MKTYGVIMAGGGGTRFWPLSRAEEPKQLLNLSGKDLMVNETIDRIATFTDKQDIFIVTNETQVPKMRTATESRIAADHILAEPAARNTSACIGYAALEIVKKYGDGIMCIFPSDHFVKKEAAFKEILGEAIKAAEEQDKLITIGIAPTFPSTGYGYIKFDTQRFAKIRQIIEKIGVTAVKMNGYYIAVRFNALYYKRLFPVQIADNPIPATRAKPGRKHDELIVRCKPGLYHFRKVLGLLAGLFDRNTKRSQSMQVHKQVIYHIFHLSIVKTPKYIAQRHSILST